MPRVPTLSAALALLAIAALAFTSYSHEVLARRRVTVGHLARELRPRRRPVPPPKPAPRPPSFEIITVRAGQSVPIHERPGGPVIGALGAETDFGSPQALSVAATSGSWLGVTTSALPNGRLAWIHPARRAVAERRTAVTLRVHLARRLLDMVAGTRVLRSIRVGVGAVTSPTPTGRFEVTDKLSGSSYGPYYGCCILALSGHQTNAPAGWGGGTRLAIHGTDEPWTIGSAASAGCVHAEAADLRTLIRSVPLGAPVFITR